MKKGFTLIEVLAVIVIISLITILVMPNLLNSVNNKRQNISDSAKQMIYDATDIYVKENSDNYPSTSGINYCIKLEDLVNSGKLVSPVKDMKTDKEIPLNYYINVTVNDYSQFEYELVEKCQLKKCTELVNNVWTYDYTGNSQVFTVPCEGNYKIETWGAEGGSQNSNGGKGGYSIGKIYLEIQKELYITVGGAGSSGSIDNITSGYNGGGIGYGKTSVDGRYFASGGGATHIATVSGVLSELENNKSSILIVSGGGGAGYYSSNENVNNKGGNAGGYVGQNGEQTIIGWGSFGYGGSQIDGGKSICDSTTCSSWAGGISSNNAGKGFFGQGGTGVTASNGGGGGYYGGGASVHIQSAGGGSSYIGNPLLTDKSMYCYDCIESNEESTKTISTTCTSSTPTANCAKQGNGYAKITYLGE